jgi:hypothetical protein
VRQRKSQKRRIGPSNELSALSHHLAARYADAMGREPAERTAPDLFSTATASVSPLPKATTGSKPQRYVLPKNLRRAVKHLSDHELDLMHAATVEELTHRGRTPKSVETDRPAPNDLTKIQSPPIKTVKLDAAEVSLTQGQVNAVRSAFKAGITPSRIAASSVFLYRMCGALWRRIKRSGESYDS